MPRPNYRRERGSDTWHFCANCSNCSNWPTGDFDSKTTHPGGELCNECLGKERAGNCS